jgi:hypothetical protein
MNRSTSSKGKRKVFLGTSNITGRYNDLAYFFNQANFDTFIVDKEKKSSKTCDSVDICLEDHWTYYYQGIRPKALQRWLQHNTGIRKKILKQAIAECELFVFFWETLFLDFSDLKLIKEAGKTIIISFVGSDIRNELLYKEELQLKGRTFFDISETMVSNYGRKQMYYKMAKENSDAIFSRPDQSQEFDQPYYRMLPFVNLNDFSLQTKKQKEVPHIVHAPSRTGIKGTDFFEKKIAELKSEGQVFTYERIENLSQKEVRKAFLDADIVIDQLYLLGGGKISVEGMAQGCVVLSAMGYGEFDELYPEQPPIVDFKETTFSYVLKDLLLNRSRRQEIADKGPDFVRRHLDCKDFVSKMIAIHEGQEVSFDFFPKS